MPAHASPLLLARQPAFVRLWACGAVLGTLRWLEVLAVGLFALEQTGSALMVALMLFARTLPMVVLGALTGVLADRVDRRTLLLCGLAVIAVTAAILATLALRAEIALWHVALGAFVNGCVWTMEHPVRRAMIGDVVDGAAMGAAISLDSSTFNGTRMAGPLAGGAVYAALGLPGAYLVGVLAYCAVFMLVWGLPRAPARAPLQRVPVWRSLRDGLGHVRASGLLAGVMLLTVIANLFGFSYAAMVPVVGERVLGLDAPGIGMLMAMEGLGASLGALGLAFVIRPQAYTRVFTAGALLFLVMVLVFARSGALLPAVTALFIAGLGLAGFGAMQSTILLASTSQAMRSRVMGVLVVCIGAGPVGVVLVGWLAERFGAVTALTLSSASGIVAVLVLCLCRPTLLARFPAAAAGVARTAPEP